MSDDLLYNIALTHIFMVGHRTARTIIDTLGSARAVFESDPATLLTMGNVGKYLSDRGYQTAALQRATKEIEQMARHNIHAVSIQDAKYPKRLAQCPDAPIVLFHTADIDLNAAKMLTIVGTRRITPYGSDLTKQLVADIASNAPDTIIVSGLAYGTDITAHRVALSCGLRTIGVVAHGLDTIYPPSHRNTASDMCRNGGGVVTEYTTNTRPDPQNFVQRNRIVAGLTDATIVVESARKGGSLITASIANDYNRDVFAFPGRIGAEFSEGCNCLIRDNKAQLITSATDVINLLKWDTPTPQATQQSLFDDEPLPPEQQQVINLLQNEPLHINTISRAIGLPIQHTSALLTNMVFDDLLLQLPGDTYTISTKRH